MQSERSERDLSFDLAVFIIRVVLGAVFFAHGAQKLLGWFGGAGMDGFSSFLSSMGMPAYMAWPAVAAEFLGALGLIFGVLPRLSSVGIIINMVVAVSKVHLGNGFFMNWMGGQKGEGYEFHLLVIAMCLLVMLVGPGHWSLPDFEARLIGLKAARRS